MKNAKISLTLLLITAVVSGCVSVGSNKNVSNTDGGVFKSVNKGTGWQQAVMIPTTSGRPASFAGINASSLVMDPGDRQALYFGSEGNGLFYTYDGGASWRPADTLLKATVKSVAVDPKNKCTIYAAIGNRVYKTSDCSRTWDQIYYDNDVMALVEYIAIDHYNSSNVYIGVSRGDIIRSTDSGSTWKTVARLNDRINKITVHPADSRVLYVLTNRRGVHRTDDGGDNWSEIKTLSEALGRMKLGSDLKDMVIAGENNTIFIATYYGMVRSDDSAETWERIELIPPERKAAINAIAVNPRDTNEIYYVTNTTFYRSQDGGVNWATIKLPTSRGGWQLLIDPQEPNIIYLAVRGMQK